MPARKEPEAKAAPPPLPPPKKPALDQNLLARLVRFYQLHEPEDTSDKTPVCEWGQQVGMEKLNAKLAQLYGRDLTTLEEDEAAALAPPPPPEDEIAVSAYIYALFVH